MAAAAILRMAGKKHASLFVGQWAAPFLLMGVYNKMVKQHGLRSLKRFRTTSKFDRSSSNAITNPFCKRNLSLRSTCGSLRGAPECRSHLKRLDEEKKLRRVIEAKWAAHLPELDLAINTGLRKGSQYGLTWDMVDWKGRMLNIPRTKNEEPLHVPLNDAAVAALRIVHDRGDGRGRVFQSTRTGEPLESGRHWFDDALIKTGIKNFHWHDLRHTFASRLRMKGAPLEDIADLLGHKSLTMTRRYAHLGPNKLHAVVSLLGASDTTSDTSQNGIPATSLQVAVQ
jgi:integrase